MSELLTHHFAVMSDRQIARKLLSLAAFVGKNETGIAKEKSIALLVVAAARVDSKKERLRKDIDDVKQLARKIAANAAEVARENQRLRLLNMEMMNVLCDRCAEESGGGSDRCPEYRADGELGRCVYSTQGYCTTRDLINKAMAEGVIPK